MVKIDADYYEIETDQEWINLILLKKIILADCV